MGQTPKPVNLYVTDKEMLGRDELKELAAKGNTVKLIRLKPNTLMIGPSCHRVLKGMERYLELIIKAARQTYVPQVKVKPLKPKKAKPKVKVNA